jgi:hypothetical protein
LELIDERFITLELKISSNIIIYVLKHRLITEAYMDGDIWLMAKKSIS